MPWHGTSCTPATRTSSPLSRAQQSRARQRPPPYAFFALSPLHSNPDSDLLTKGRSLLGSKPNTGGSQAGWSTTSSASGVQTIFGKGRPEKVILTLIHDILTLIHAILTLIHAI